MNYQYKTAKGRRHPVHAADLKLIAKSIRKAGWPKVVDTNDLRLMLAKIFDDVAKHVRSLR